MRSPELFYNSMDGNENHRTDIIFRPHLYGDILSKSLEIRWTIPTHVIKTWLEVGNKFQTDKEAIEDYISYRQASKGDGTKISRRRGLDRVTKKLKIKTDELGTYDFSSMASNLEILAIHFRQPLFNIGDNFPKLNRLEIIYWQPIEFPISLENCFDSLNVLDVTVKMGHQFMGKIRNFQNLTTLNMSHSVVDDVSFEDISEIVLSLQNLRKLDLGFLLRNNLDSISISYADLVSMVTKSKTLEYLDVSGSNMQSYSRISPPERKLEFFGLVYCNFNKNDALTAYKVAKHVASLNSLDSLLEAGKAYVKRRFLFDVILDYLKMQYPFDAVYVSQGWMERFEEIIMDGISVYLEDAYIMEKLKDLLVRILHSQMFTSAFLDKTTNMICSICQTPVGFPKNRETETIIYDLGFEFITNTVLSEYAKKVLLKGPTSILAAKLSDHIDRFKRKSVEFG